VTSDEIDDIVRHNAGKGIFARNLPDMNRMVPIIADGFSGSTIAFP
jgi:hypothetical protein